MGIDVSGGSVARRCAVLGSPIAHSLSPVLHRAAYAELGLDWSYEAIEVDGPRLELFLAGLDATWRGLSLTMPLKRTVMPLLDEADSWAVVSGGANTVVLEAGRLLGHNTDVPGAVAALAEVEVPDLRRAVVLGGGATAASVLLALSELGCQEARLLVRNPARAVETLAALDRHGRGPGIWVGRLTDPLEPADVVVSTIPAEAQTPALAAAAAAARVVFDVLYDPWPTPLAAAAAAHGAVVVGGLDLLVHQAALQVRLMTGREAPLDVMRAAGESALAARPTDGAGDRS
ncbi:shikimate dehydrogenase [Nocardioides pocheonensis]|uniref:Shikimate dehydrogenase n=1 Tax=Nocardioides pocheonensis TaxID=661485 RepID=A0A3N0GFU2_9ACTN|nr:shikimate dehydrogenase [Nocardioides pocheonensis]RNM11008.1 shikimate dehydrogenase [Nocardioides pocheonensis]